MLNISNNSINDKINVFGFDSIKKINQKYHYKKYNKFLLLILGICILFVFLPWTQNIKGSGFVTSLSPDQRPQTIHSTISGKIEKWYVNEGQFVKKGDTLLFISEVKEEYFDPNLVANTGNQVTAKKRSLESYDGKVSSLTNQIQAISYEKQLKIEQANNKILQAQLKIKSDSMDFIASKTQLNIAKTQFDRSVELHKEGLKPLSDVEDKRLKLQDADAKVITQQNKYLASKNELINAKVEINRITAEYSDKYSKAQSEKFTAVSNQYETVGEVNKLENQYENYKKRNEYYYIKAPQDGYINRALQAGIGEIIKEGTAIMSIMPSNYNLAVETYVDPIDLPLIHKGESVRVWFDGWPTIVFSGWPNASFGTFGGKVVAIENFISENGKYRVLIAQDEQQEKWPSQLSIGAGAKTLTMLDNVPIWFELWRNLNGFPPNFYVPNSLKKE
jgi:multidrug resistance efflux pump